MISYTNYTPDFKCDNDGNNKGIVSAGIGLLTYDEAIYAGYYIAPIISSNYLSNKISWWTMSTAGLDTIGISNIWFSSSDRFGNVAVYGSNILRPVVNIKSNVQVSSGDGTKENPFVVE